MDFPEITSEKVCKFLPDMMLITRMIRISLCTVLLFCMETAILRGSAENRTALLASEIQEIRKNSHSPEEIVQRIESLLQSYPRQRITRRPQGEKPSSSSEPTANPALNNGDSLIYESRQVLSETRKAAKTVEQQVALVDEFFRLNADVLIWSKLKSLDTVQKAERKEAHRLWLQNLVFQNPNSLFAEAAYEAWQVRIQAHSPEESVLFMDEFLRLNKETLNAERKRYKGAALQNHNLE